MIRDLLTTAFIFLLLGTCLLVEAKQAVASHSEFAIVTEGHLQNNPDVWGDIVAWEDYRIPPDYNYNHIYLYDFKTGIEYQLTDEVRPAQATPDTQWFTGEIRLFPSTWSFQDSPHVEDGWVVWIDARNGNYDIYLYDLTEDSDSDGIPNWKENPRPEPDPAEIGLVTDPYHQIDPYVDGNYVVWEDYRNDTLPPTPGVCPGDPLTGETGVFKCDYKNSDIYIYDLSMDSDGDGIPNYRESPRPDPDPAERRLTTDPDPQRRPEMDGNHIAWRDLRNDDDLYDDVRKNDIYMYDLETNTETQVTDEPDADQFDPRVSQGRIIWRDKRDGDSDVYMYTIATAQERAITSDSLEQQRSAIQGDLIVYGEAAPGGADLYAFDLAKDLRYPISTSTGTQFRPYMDRKRVVWVDRRNDSPGPQGPTNSDVYMAGNTHAIPGYPTELEFALTFGGDEWDDMVSVSFPTVSDAGDTAVEKVAAPGVDSAYVLRKDAGNDMVYEIITTALYSGPFEVCFRHSQPTTMTPWPLVLHWNGSGWDELPIASRTPDGETAVSCAISNSLSTFALGGPNLPPTGAPPSRMLAGLLLLLVGWALLTVKRCKKVS